MTSATIHPTELVISIYICDSILEKNPLHAISAHSLARIQLVWGVTCIHTLAKKSLLARNVDTLANGLVFWRDMWKSSTLRGPVNKRGAQNQTNLFWFRLLIIDTICFSKCVKKLDSDKIKWLIFVLFANISFFQNYLPNTLFVNNYLKIYLWKTIRGNTYVAIRYTAFLFYYFFKKWTPMMWLICYTNIWMAC